MDERAESLLVAAADAIAAGNPVDWEQLRRQLPDPDDTAVIDQLRILNGIAAAHAEPSAWNGLAIIGPLGRGSFGTVYRAYDPDLQREVALKILTTNGTTGIDPERAVQEARLLARVNHANVVTVYGAQRTDQEVGIWMELIKGHTLDMLIERQGPFSAREATLVGLDLCRALAAVHGAGLLHGDVKAHNVMREEGGRIVLMDFGTGRELHREPHHPQDDAAGTPVYLAPEVFAGQARSKASDLYSLGVLLYYLVTGSYPVEGDTRTQVERLHEARVPRRRLRDARPDLPDRFIQVVEKSTAESPGDRYATAGELEAALSDALEGSSAPARIIPFRHRLAVASVFVAAIALGGIAYWTVGSRTGSSDLAQANSAVAAPANVSTAAVDRAYQVDAAVYRVEQGGNVRLQPNARLSPGDKLFLQIETSVPAHVYIVNEDERGESYLLFPLPGQAPANPLPAGARNRLPGPQSGREMYWQVTSAGGREHFLMFVSPERLPALEQMFAALATPRTDQPVLSARLSNEAVGVLRGIGGLATAPPAQGQSPRLATQFATPLGNAAETARGLWVRQVTFDNPTN